MGIMVDCMGLATNVRLESLYQHTSFTRGESRRDFGVKKGVLESFVGWMVSRISNIHPKDPGMS